MKEMYSFLLWEAEGEKTGEAGKGDGTKQGRKGDDLYTQDATGVDELRRLTLAGKIIRCIIKKETVC
jgi:hypothetical protein